MPWFDVTKKTLSILLETMAGINYIFFSVLCMFGKGEIINCIGDECKENEDIRCEQTNEICTVNCIDDDSCFASHIFCNEHTDCHIFCNGEQSCLKSKINCPSSADCFVNGLNLNSLSQSIIKCPIANTKNCQINCDSSLSCHNTLIDAQNSEQLQLHCNEGNSCLDFTLYCPEFNEVNDEPNCIISGMDKLIWSHKIPIAILYIYFRQTRVRTYEFTNLCNQRS